MNDYFYIVDKRHSNNAWTYTVRINPACSVLKGHFPDKPIFPGVCSLQMIVDCLADATRCEIMLQRINRCKFTSLLLPDNMDLLVKMELNDNKLTASITRNATTCVQLSANINALPK